MTTLYLRSAKATTTEFIVDASYTLTVGKTASAPTDAVNKSVLDTAVGALTTVINTITGSTFELNGAFDQLPEIMAAVTTEISDRNTAVAAEAASRLAADTTETDARVAAVSAEADARLAADTTEYNARVAAVAAEAATRLASDIALEATISDACVVPYSSAIYADGSKPIPMSAALLNAGHQGWYYTNNGTQATGKINWYMVNNTSAGASLKFNTNVGQIKEIDIPVTLFSKISAPFITIYTARKGDGNDAASWYRAKKTWSVDGDGAGIDFARMVNGGQYLFRVNINAPALTASYPDYINIDLLHSVVATSSNGTFSLDDTILLIALGTDSAALQNNANFVVKHFEMRTSLGNKKQLFSNDSVLNNHLLQKLELLYSDFYQTSILP
jgi:hypothetical protein